MDNKKKVRNLLLYLGIPILIILAVAMLYGSRQTETPKTSELVQYFEKNMVDDATTRIKNSLIIDKISKEADVKVEQADFQNKIGQMAGAYGVGPQELLKQFGQNPDFLSSLSQQIVNDKVREFLLDNNNIEYVEVKSEEQKVEA